MPRRALVVILACSGLGLAACGDEDQVPAPSDLAVARVAGVEQPGVLAYMDPCQEDDPGSGCTSIPQPVSRRIGRPLPDSVNLQLRPGTKVKLDVGGPARGVRAYLARYRKVTAFPLGARRAGGAVASRPGVVTVVPAADVKAMDEDGRRWTVTAPEAADGRDLDLLVLRVDHAGRVGTPRSTAAGAAGSEPLDVAWYEVRIRFTP